MLVERKQILMFSPQRYVPMFLYSDRYTFVMQVFNKYVHFVYIYISTA